jgi:hypothetical protein
MKLAIVPEDDVPVPPGGRRQRRRHDVTLDQYVKQLCAMRVGQSCFFAGVTRQEVEFLRRPAVNAGINLRIIEIEHDLIHLTPGVRVWRESGPYDDPL